MPITSTCGFSSSSSKEVVYCARPNSRQRIRQSSSLTSHTSATFHAGLFNAAETTLRPSPRPSTPSPSFFIGARSRPPCGGAKDCLCIRGRLNADRGAFPPSFVIHFAFLVAISLSQQGVPGDQPKKVQRITSCG